MSLRSLLLCLSFSLGLIVRASLFSQTGQEFSGPFKSWADLKLKFGAKGNGVNDDTKSFQNAINALSDLNSNTGKNGTGFSVLYLPKGTYCISSTLVLRGKIGVTIIGE